MCMLCRKRTWPDTKVVLPLFSYHLAQRQPSLPHLLGTKTQRPAYLSMMVGAGWVASGVYTGAGKPPRRNNPYTSVWCLHFEPSSRISHLGHRGETSMYKTTPNGWHCSTTRNTEPRTDGFRMKGVALAGLFSFRAFLAHKGVAPLFNSNCQRPPDLDNIL